MNSKLVVAISVLAYVTAPIYAFAQTTRLAVKDTAGSQTFAVTDVGRIGIGTSAPGAGIHVVGTTGTQATVRLEATTSNATDAPGVMMLKNNPTGTNSLPLSGNRIGVLAFGAMDGTTTRAAAGIFGFANGDWTSTSTPTSISFETTQPGLTSRSQAMFINSSQYTGLGTANPTQRLEVNGGIRLNTTTARPDCTFAARGVVWFSQSSTGEDLIATCKRYADGSYKWAYFFTMAE